MKTFIPRHSTKNQRTPQTPTDKTDKTRCEGGFVSFVSDPKGYLQEKHDGDELVLPSPSFDGDSQNTLLPLLTKLTKAIDPLPWQLERLITAASSGVLNIHPTGVPDTTRYVMAWACAYLAGDKEEALRRLWEVYNTWQPSN